MPTLSPVDTAPSSKLCLDPQRPARLDIIVNLPPRIAIHTHRAADDVDDGALPELPDHGGIAALAGCGTQHVRIAGGDARRRANTQPSSRCAIAAQRNNWL